MSHWGVSAVRWNNRHTEIESCRIHAIRRGEGRFEYETSDPTEMPYQDVANLIVSGDIVWVLVADSDGNFERGHNVGVKQGQNEYLTSFNAEGGNHSLYELPKY